MTVPAPSVDDLLQGVRPIGLLTILRDEHINEFIGDIQRVSVSKGEVLIDQDVPATDVYIVISGALQAVMTMKDGAETIFGEIKPGEPAGEMQIFTGGKRNTSVVATADTDLIKLPKATFEKMAVLSPRIVKRMAAISRRRLRKNQVTIILSNFLGPLEAVNLDFLHKNTEWVYLKRGESLFRQGDPGESLAVLISGRLLAAVQDNEGAERVVGEITQGELVGEMSILTNEPRTASVHALRDSLLAVLSNKTIEQIIMKYPQVMMYTTRTIIARLTKSMRAAPQKRLMTSIAVVPANPDVPLREFVDHLENALSRYTPTLRLNSERLDSLIGIQGIAQTKEGNPYDGRLSTALAEQATRQQLIIYESDLRTTPWTRRCIRQADQVLILASAHGNSAPGEIEYELLDFDTDITAAGRTLVLLHPDTEELPTHTARWLSVRKVDAHYHVRTGREDDYQRLARIFTGNAIGLVLGGGGARGLAHLGVIKAMREYQIPIDMIGGCSIGSIIAAQPAMDWDQDYMMKLNSRFFVDGKPVSDFTLPALSIVKGKRLEQYLQKGFGDTRIEDLWITYFCVSSNLSKADLVIHKKGLLWQAIRKSISIPGVFPPVLEGNDLLIDGGLLNNLPGDIMQRMCKGRVIAVDVNPKLDFIIHDKTLPSPWEVIRYRMLQTSKEGTNVPSILDVLTRSTMLGSIHKTDDVKSNVDLYLNPPIDQFNMLEFSSLHKIAEIGYQYAKEELPKWKAKQAVL